MKRNWQYQQNKRESYDSTPSTEDVNVVRRFNASVLFTVFILYYTYVKNDGSIQEAWHCVPLINPVNGLVLIHPPLEILPKNLF